MIPATLTQLLEARTNSDVGITFITSAADEKRVSYQHFYHLAQQRLGQFQMAGAGVGDHLIIQRIDNEEFLVSFWACLLGGIVAVPVAPGNSAEHRQKLFRIASKLENAWLCTDQENALRVQKFALEQGLDSEWQVMHQHSYSFLLGQPVPLKVLC